MPDGDIGAFFIFRPARKGAANKKRLLFQHKELSGVLSIGETCKKLNLVDVADVRTGRRHQGVQHGHSVVNLRRRSVKHTQHQQLAVDGIESVVGVLKELEDGKLKDIDFVEMRACQAGCVGGVLNITNTFVAKKQDSHAAQNGAAQQKQRDGQSGQTAGVLQNNWKWETKDVFKLDGNVLKAMEKDV